MPTGKLISNFEWNSKRKKQPIPKSGAKPMPGKKVPTKSEEPKTEHPGQTEMERKILDHIGCGGYNLFELNKTKQGHKAIKDLASRGMIEKIPDIRPGEYMFQMPIPVHMQWCMWGRDHYEEGIDDSIGGPNDR